MPEISSRLAACVFPLFFAAGTALAVNVGDKAPAFALTTAQGDTVSLETLRGRVVYVDFWASWCGPCRRSFAWMNALQQRYGGRGMTIVAVNVDKRREDAERFLRQYPATFAVVYDAAGTTPGAYDVKTMPSSYVIDRDGRVAAVENGYHEEREAELEARIRAIVDARR